MINCNLLKLFFIWKFVELILTSLGALKYDCRVKSSEMFRFMPLVNSLVTNELGLLLIISAKTVTTLGFFLECPLQYFYRHLVYYQSIQLKVSVEYNALSQRFHISWFTFDILLHMILSVLVYFISIWLVVY